MSATERILAERAFHDAQARERAQDLDASPDRLRFTDDVYLDHETWVRPAFNELGVLTGRRILDFGCGHGMAAVVLARAGAEVTALDLSPGYLEEARTRARANDTHVSFVQANGERLPFPDRYFDGVWGNAVLHHLDLAKAGPELRRVLQPHGVAVFSEPWGENPILNWARKSLPYPGKHRTPDEEPLMNNHVQVLRRIFPSVQIRGFQLLSMARRAIRARRLVASLDWCDEALLLRIPALQRFCRYVVLTLRK